MLYAFKTLKGGKPSNCSRTIRITSYYYFLSAKKKIYAVIRIKKLLSPSYSTSRKMFLIHPTYLTFDRLRSYSTYCEKPLLADLLQNRLHDMHENWHFIAPSLADQTALLKMRVQWSLRELLPLKRYDFDVKIHNS